MSVPSDTLQHTWRSGNVEREDETALNYTVKLLQRLEAILHDESRRAAPHSCLRYVASSQAYIIVTKLGVSSSNADIIRTSAQLFHILINGEAEGLLDSKLFTRSLLDLVSYGTIGGGIMFEERLQTDLVELLFEIATKIRLDPDILPAWFYPERETTRGRNATDDSRRSQFPLFHVLVQYVHHDGPAGDFARTALLYLTETASKFRPLETWMIESDLAPQMASGLGALYSRLSRQSPTPLEHLLPPPIVVMSDRSETITSIAEPPPEAQQESKAFFTYLAFWQDTLNHCKSVEVSDTLLDHFQVLFVQQLLYPSLLESSDVEGGSTAAVISHVSQILRALRHLQLVDRILRYLLASPSVPQQARDRSQRRPRMSVSRRKSVDHLKALAEVADSPSPNLFNLFDLMVMSLKSQHVGTVNACLRLLSVILEDHHDHVLTSLFRVEPAARAPGQRGVKQLNSSLHKLVKFSAIIAKNPDMDASYEGALADGQVMLERHSCYGLEDGDRDHVGPGAMSVSRDCKLFDAILAVLQSFFANDTTTNLNLTQAILDLSACQHMSLHGWLLPPDARIGFEDSSAFNVTFIIGQLVEQVRQWRSQFPNWDELIYQRRLDLDEDEPPQRPSTTRGISGQSLQVSTGLRSTSPPNAKAGSRPTTPKKISTAEFGSIDSAISMSGGHRGTFVERTLAHSPLRRSTPVQSEKDEDGEPESFLHPSVPAILKTQIQLSYTKAPEEASESLPVHAGRKQTSSPAPDRKLALHGSDDAGAATPVGDRDETGLRSQVSLSHILTNAIILQEFILELAAIVQLRATFFNEVDFGSTVSD